MSFLRHVNLDVLIPVYNEEESLPILFGRLEKVFSQQAQKENGLKGVRYIFIDDGSTDNSAKLISDFISRGACALLLRLSRNFGHQNALAAGLAKSDAALTAVIDADLQDPPEVILKMLDHWRQGYKVVYGVRRKRKEGLFNRLAYWSYYRILWLLSEVKVPKDSGDFCLMDRIIVQNLMKLPEKLRFPRGLRAWVGFRQIGYEYERERRQAGKTKYPFKDMYKLATDGITSLSLRPMKIIQFCAFCFALFFLLSFSVTLVWLVTKPGQGPSLWFLISYTMSAMTGFTVLFSLYIICAYLGRMFFEVKARPSYIIMEELGVGTQRQSMGDGKVLDFAESAVSGVMQ